MLKQCVGLVLLLCFHNYAEALSDPEQKKLNQVQALYQSGDKVQAKTSLLLAIKLASDKNEVPGRSFLYQAHLLLANISAKNGNYADQLQTLKQLMALLQKWQLNNTADAVTVMQNMAQVSIQLGEEKQAIDTFEQSLTLARQVYKPQDIRLLNILLSLARAHTNRLEAQQASIYHAEIEAALNGKTEQPYQVLKGRLLQSKGELLFRQAKTKQAAGFYKQALQVRESIFGSKHMETGQTVSALAGALKGLHRLSESEEYYRKAFAIYENALGIEHPFIATLLNNMGQLYYLEGRFDESEKVLLRAIEIKKKRLGDDHPSLADSYNHYGYLLYVLERDDEALVFLNNAIKIWRSPRSLRPRYASSAETWRAVIHHRRGQSEQALQELQQVLTKLENIFGKKSIATAEVYHQIAKILNTLGQGEQAEQYFIKGLERAGLFGQGDWLGEILIHSDLGIHYADNNDFKNALKQARESVKGLELRVIRHSGLRAHSLNAELKSLRRVLINHIDIVSALMQKTKGCTQSFFGSENDCPNADDLLNESFSSAQLARSTSTARALAQVSQRFSNNKGELAEMIRQRQDLLEEWQEIENLLSSALFSSAKDRNLDNEQSLNQLASELEQKIQQLDTGIKDKYPDYSALTKSSPLSIKQVQSYLLDKQALVVYLIGKEKSYLWVVTQKDAAVFPLDIGEEAIEASVRKLRYRLDPSNLGNATSIPPIPIDKAYHLYQKILAPAKDILKDIDHLIFVPDKSLQSLPLSVLITQPPNKEIKTPEDHRDVDWLIRSKAISNLPSVESLQVLRKVEAEKRQVKNPFLGIGDPALAKSAKNYALRGNKQQSLPSGLRSIVGVSRSMDAVDVLTQMIELPETADELRKVSSILGGTEKDLILRDQATETNVKAQSIADYNVVHFATHGLMAGDFQGLFEPALVMTLSPNQTDIDDNGLLTASEITQLQLNARLIVLSACNTAADDGTPGAEGLSGLGRAFFYAGGRALFVSNWAVASDATVDLTIAMFQHDKKQPNLGMAKAHRLSMLDLMADTKHSYFAHPMFWAPFVVVGTGKSL